MEREILNKLKYLINKKKDIQTILENLGLKEYELLGLLEILKKEGYNTIVNDNKVMNAKTPSRINDVYEIPNRLETLKLLLISDTHLCSKYERLDILRYLYDKAENKGITYILHSGDFTDGKSNRSEHIYELKETSYEGQIDYVIDKYPQYNGKTYTIQGNHDNWWYKSTGSEIVKAIANKRDDIVYLGSDVADLKIGKLKIRLYHGQGKQAYSISYKLQRYNETIPIKEKPHILQTGHIHQSFYMLQDKTHCFQTSALIDNTPYSRSMGLKNDKSCWWITVHMDNNGDPIIIEPQLETFENKKLILRKRDY